MRKISVSDCLCAIFKALSDNGYKHYVITWKNGTCAGRVYLTVTLSTSFHPIHDNFPANSFFFPLRSRHAVICWNVPRTATRERKGALIYIFVLFPVSKRVRESEQHFTGYCFHWSILHNERWMEEQIVEHLKRSTHHISQRSNVFSKDFANKFVGLFLLVISVSV